MFYDAVKTAVILTVITKADLVKHNELRKTYTDLGSKAIEFQREKKFYGYIQTTKSMSS
jgi:hypothetical protein